jgi:hypothetical protein
VSVIAVAEIVFVFIVLRLIRWADTVFTFSVLVVKS